MELNFSKFFGTNTQQQTDFQLDIRFPWDLAQKDFTEWFCKNLYRKVLLDCYARAADFPQKKESVLWDSVVNTQSARGLVSILAEGMTDTEHEVYLLYVNNTVRPALTEEERQAILNDLTGDHGIILSFKDFYQTKILKQLAALLFCALKNANTGLHLSQSVILKISGLRENISVLNSQGPTAQAKALVQALTQDGKGAMLDSGDLIETPPFDPEPMEKTLDVIFGLISLSTGLPRSYVDGLVNSGLSDTGEADSLAVERALSFYFNSIFKPVCDKLLKCNLVYKRSSWRKFAEVANLLPVLEATDMVPTEYKEKLIKELFG